MSKDIFHVICSLACKHRKKSPLEFQICLRVKKYRKWKMSLLSLLSLLSLSLSLKRTIVVVHMCCEYILNNIYIYSIYQSKYQFFIFSSPLSLFFHFIFLYIFFSRTFNNNNNDLKILLKRFFIFYLFVFVFVCVCFFIVVVSYYYYM